MTLSLAFTTAWNDLKAVALKAASFVAKQAPVINKVVSVGSIAIEALDPALTPAVTAFDSLEASLVGEITAAIGSVTTAPDPASFFTVSLPGTLWPALKAIEQTLTGHPAVVAAKVAAPITAKGTL
jgi:hypothetical protein